MATKNLPLSGAKRRSIPTEALGILVLIPYDNSGTSRSGLPAMDIWEIEILLSVFLSSPGGVSGGGMSYGPPAATGAAAPFVAEGGFRRTLLLSAGILLWSGMVEGKAGSDTFLTGFGTGAFGSWINMRGPVAPISC